MSKAGKKDKAQTSIAIVALSDGYLLNGFKIAIQRTDGSGATQMIEVAGSRVGTTCIPAQYLREMFETSGQKVIEVNKENGNEEI
jgi:hypothetical protein